MPLAFVTETAPTLASMARPRRKSPPAGEGSFGERLRKLRVAKGLTQAELGHHVQLSNRMVAYYEIQGGEPRPELVTRLSEALGVSVAVLLGQKDSMKRQLPEAPSQVRLWRRFKRIEELPVHDRKTILKMIDAMADARRKAS